MRTTLARETTVTVPGRRHGWRERLALACALALPSTLLLAGPSSAQSPTREGTAQALFDEGTALFARGDFDRACDKFRASNELDTKGGTLLNLALCREKQGRTASAWTTFSEARNRSLKEGRNERVVFADKKIAELRAVIPHLRVVVTDGPPALDIKVDGETLPRAAWNTSLPIDPGQHQIGVTAPDHRPATLTVRAAPGEETVATVPKLAREPTREPLRAEPPVVHAPSGTRWAGWTVLGVGAVSLGVGSVFGLQAFSKRSDAESLCASSRCEEGRRANDDGVRAAWIANVAIGVGVVAIAAGAYFLLRDPGPSSTIR